MAKRLRPIPCPYCGGNPVILTEFDGPDVYAIIMCETKDCQSGQVGMYDSLYEAIQAWNEQVIE